MQHCALEFHSACSNRISSKQWFFSFLAVELLPASACLSLPLFSSRPVCAANQELTKGISIHVEYAMRAATCQQLQYSSQYRARGALSTVEGRPF